MKKLIDKTKDPMDTLIADLFQLCNGQTSIDSIRKVVSDYTVNYNQSCVGYGILPEFVKQGNRIHITREVDDHMSWDYTGEVVDVWYRGITYDTMTVVNVLKEMNITDHFNMRVYDETRPAIYHRIALRTDEVGMLIVPCVKGMKIERVAEPCQEQEQS